MSAGDTSTVQVPVTCDSCGAELERHRVQQSDELRTSWFECTGCGAESGHEDEALTVAVAFLCGPGAPGRVTIPTWGPRYYDRGKPPARKGHHQGPPPVPIRRASSLLGDLQAFKATHRCGADGCRLCHPELPLASTPPSGPDDMTGRARMARARQRAGVELSAGHLEALEVALCAGRSAVAHEPTAVTGDSCPVCGEVPA